MKSPLIFSVLVGALCCGCGELETSPAKPSGIHQGTTTSVSLPQGKSPDGFLPAPVALTVKQSSVALPKDKHGMPTYMFGTPHRYVRTTAYSHQEKEKGAPWKKNALGTYLRYGKVRSAAADWSRYPVGTQFKIKGLPHTYEVDDYGSALVGTNTVDIYHPTLRSMNRWGTRWAEITVTKWGSLEKTTKILSGRLKYRHTRQMYYAAKKKLDNGGIASN